MKVLLIESNAQLRDGYALYLKAEGWDVLCADSLGVDEMVEEYAAVIVDASIEMPDGEPLWQWLAAEGQSPVIALALSSRQEEALYRTRLPRVTSLVKPFSLSRLAEQLRRLQIQRHVA